MAFLKRRHPTRTEFDEFGVRRLRRKEILQQLAWSELVAVDVVTTADGPWGEDLFFILTGPEDSSIVVPSDRAPDGFLERLQQLPGFDNEAVIAGSTSSDNARFRCWSR